MKKAELSGLRDSLATLKEDDVWSARSIIFEEHCATTDERPFRALMAHDKLVMIAAKMPAALAEIERLRSLLVEACDIGQSALNQIDDTDDGVQSNVYTASKRLAAIRAAVGGE